ncbi:MULTISPECIES: hypothetical protein [Bradyrhizobium]|uniref:hypothetical protein n=1 Tax=Bradyrhizobium pachyrhizi TaxID=280333 RepID=UPI00047F8CF9
MNGFTLSTFEHNKKKCLVISTIYEFDFYSEWRARDFVDAFVADSANGRFGVDLNADHVVLTCWMEDAFEFTLTCQPRRDLSCAMRSAPRELPLLSIAQPDKSKVRANSGLDINFGARSTATSIRAIPHLLGLAEEKSDFDPVRL